MGEVSEDNLSNANVSTSQMSKGASATVLWKLIGWSEYSDFLRDTAGCVVEVPVSSSKGEQEDEANNEEEEVIPTIKIRFFFKEYVEHGTTKSKRWLSLWVLLLSQINHKVSILVQVVEEECDVEEDEEVDEGGEEGDVDSEDDDEDLEVNSQITFSVDKGKQECGENIEMLVKQKFLPMGWWKTDKNGKQIGKVNLTEWANSSEIELKITATEFKYAGSDMVEDQEEEDAPPEENTEEREVPPLIRDIKAMHAEDETFADLTLETRDGVSLNAHKFVLAARSPFFRALIEKEMMRKGFSGTIKMGNVDGKPMAVVLHWMYTDELDQEQLSKVMDEVIKVSVKWELQDLLRLLDKQLISVCNTRNMLHLFQVAHKNGLYTAITDISNFIKENIDSVVPTR